MKWLKEICLKKSNFIDFKAKTSRNLVLGFFVFSL